MLTSEQSLQYSKELYENTQGSPVTAVVKEGDNVFIYEYQTKCLKIPVSSTKIEEQVKQLDAQKIYLTSLQTNVMEEESKIIAEKPVETPPKEKHIETLVEEVPVEVVETSAEVLEEAHIEGETV